MDMTKDEALALLGGDQKAQTMTARRIGISKSAVNKWPDKLTRAITDRVIAACIRHGIEVPKKFLS